MPCPYAIATTGKAKAPASEGGRYKSKRRGRARHAVPQQMRRHSTKGRGLRPGLFVQVAMTAGAAMGSGGVLRRRRAAETRVIMRPTGKGSMKV